MARKPKGDIRVRRAYEEPEAEDGTRVLVDRMWPRGLAKDVARFDEWAKDVTPSTELRRWFHGPQGEFGEFRRRYLAELDEPGPAAGLRRLRDLADDGPMTLLTASKDPSHSHVSVLLERLRGS